MPVSDRICLGQLLEARMVTLAMGISNVPVLEKIEYYFTFLKSGEVLTEVWSLVISVLEHSSMSCITFKTINICICIDIVYSVILY